MEHLKDDRTIMVLKPVADGQLIYASAAPFSVQFTGSARKFGSIRAAPIAQAVTQGNVSCSP